MIVDKYNFINSTYKGGDNMAVLTCNKPNSFVIDARDASKFITESNKQTISKAFLEECKNASKLFKKR